MANVTVNGNNYTGVTEVLLPITDGGGSEQKFIIPSGSKNITANGNGIDVASYASVNVNVPSDTPSLQQKSVTAPASGTTAVTPDSGYDGLSRVTVSPTPTETKSITANGTYTPTSGKHFSQVTVNVSGDAPETQEKTVSPSTSQQVVMPDSGKLLSKVTVNAMPTGTAGTPTASKGAVSNHSVTVTPSVTNVTGYITGGTKTGTPVTVSASELVSGSETKTQNGTYDVTNLAQLVVNVSGGGGASYQTASGSFNGPGQTSGSLQNCGFQPDIVIVQPPDSYYEGQTQYPNAFMLDFRGSNIGRTVTGASFIGTLSASNYRGIGGYGTLRSNGWLPSYFYEDDYSGSSTAITYPTNKTYTWTAYKFS